MEFENRNRLFIEFQQFIIEFKRCPSLLKTDTPQALLKHHEFMPAILFWLALSLAINLFGLLYLILFSSDYSYSAALMSQALLVLTLFSRSPLLNNFLFEKTTYLKNYLVHQIIYQLGSFHRLMAISMISWLVIHLYFKPFAAPYLDECLAFTLLLLLVLIAVSAIQFIRTKFHDYFENIHRYASYLALATLILYLISISQQRGLALEHYVYLADTYLITIALWLTVYPWLGVKRIRPIIQHISNHLIILRLQGKPQFGTFTRLTLANKQFHSFSDSIFDFNDQNSFSLLISNSGDRTKKVIEAANNNKNLLTCCTIRRHRNYGFMHHVAAYDSVLIVATGGGIAPVLPHLALNKKTQITVLWIGHQQVKEFTPEFFLSMNKHISKKQISLHIINKSRSDINPLTPDSIHQLIFKAYEHYSPEALFIVSNKTLTRKIQSQCHQRGIKGYGATFDS